MFLMKTLFRTTENKILKAILNEVRIDKLKNEIRAYEENKIVNNQKLILLSN